LVRSSQSPDDPESTLQSPELLTLPRQITIRWLRGLSAAELALVEQLVWAAGVSAVNREQLRTLLARVARVETEVQRRRVKAECQPLPVTRTSDEPPPCPQRSLGRPCLPEGGHRHDNLHRKRNSRIPRNKDCRDGRNHP
jgi:hypothetical protein